MSCLLDSLKDRIGVDDFLTLLVLRKRCSEMTMDFIKRLKEFQKEENKQDKIKKHKMKKKSNIDRTKEISWNIEKN